MSYDYHFASSPENAKQDKRMQLTNNTSVSHQGNKSENVPMMSFNQE